MIRKQFLFGCLLAASMMGSVASRQSAAEEYVWTRINTTNVGGSYMTNGYGSYYVPKRMVSDVSQGQPVKNPGGFIAQTPQPQQMQQPQQQNWRRWGHRR